MCRPGTSAAARPPQTHGSSTDRHGPSAVIPTGGRPPQQTPHTAHGEGATLGSPPGAHQTEARWPSHRRLHVQTSSVKPAPCTPHPCHGAHLWELRRPLWAPLCLQVWPKATRPHACPQPSWRPRIQETTRVGAGGSADRGCSSRTPGPRVSGHPLQLCCKLARGFSARRRQSVRRKGPFSKPALARWGR